MDGIACFQLKTPRFSAKIVKSLLTNLNNTKGMKPLVKKTGAASKLLVVLALCFALCGTALILPIRVFAGEISNGILTLAVQDDPQETAYASFMLRKATEESTLTYAQFYSSYTTVSINGVSYRFGEGEVVTPAYLTENNEVVAVQRFDGVQVTQTLKLTTGNSSKEDMLLIAYSAENQTENEVLLSVRMLIDPTIAKSETDMVQVNGKPCDMEKTFVGAEIADNWCIKNASGDIVAYGIVKSESGKPDRMQVANWDKLYDQKLGYQTAFDAAVEDNAVALIWENKQLSADASMDFSTKYGLYSEEPTGGEDNPQTGDYLHTIVPVILFTLSGLCMVAFVVINWKRRAN
jgi:hypothetical protein